MIKLSKTNNIKRIVAIFMLLGAIFYCSNICYAEDVSVTGVTLDKTTATLDLSGTKTVNLVATVAPTNATNKDVTWTSSATNVATVDNTGKVTAVANGTTTITAKTSNDKTATCSITVITTATGIKLNKTTLSLEVNKTETLTATIEPTTVTDKKITWTSDKTDIATVDENGKVTAKKAGTATITAKTTNGKTATSAVTVTVPEAKTLSNIVKIEIEYHNISKTEIENVFKDVTEIEGDNIFLNVIEAIQPITINEKKDIDDILNIINKSTVYPEEEFKKDFEANNPGGSGIEAKLYDSNGKKYVLNAHDNYFPSKKLNVFSLSSKDDASDLVRYKTSENLEKKLTDLFNKYKVEATGITLNKTSAELTVNGIETLVATVAPSNTTDKTVIWTSDKTDIVTVDKSGKVTAKKVGTATITAKTVNGKSVSCTITVKEASKPKGELPKAGMEYKIIVVAIIAIAILAIGYKKYNSYRKIKY